MQWRQYDQQLILLVYSYSSSLFMFLKSTQPILAPSLVPICTLMWCLIPEQKLLCNGLSGEESLISNRKVSFRKSPEMYF